MNKKIFLLISSLCLLSSSLFSCSSSIDKITLPYGNLFDSSLDEDSHYKKISYSDFLAMISEDKSPNTNYLNFLLLVRGSSEDCRCYTSVQSNLNKYIKKI